MTESDPHDPNEINDDVPPGEYRIAVLGRQIEEFWDSRVGQYLLERSLREYNSAVEGLKKCNPTDMANIAKFQSEAIRAESFRDWLSEAIEDGIRAKKILEGQDE